MQEDIEILDNHFANAGHELSVYMAWQHIRAALIEEEKNLQNTTDKEWKWCFYDCMRLSKGNRRLSCGNGGKPETEEY